MSRRLSLFVSLAAGALILQGCQSGPSIVGNWTGEVPQVSDFHFNLGADGKGTMGGKIQGTPISVDNQVSYTIKGDTLTVTIDDIKVDGATGTIAEMAKQQVEKEKGKQVEFKMTFKGSDQVELVPQVKDANTPLAQQTLVLNRKK